jgi:hypothetical protein
MMMVLVVGALHVIGFVALFTLVASSPYHLGASGSFTIGIGITAYTLGMRHAFDTDHISAIDNTTRKLMSEGKRAAQRRVLVLARALHDRVRTRVPDLVRRPLTRRAREERQRQSSSSDRLGRHNRLRQLPRHHRRTRARRISRLGRGRGRQRPWRCPGGRDPHTQYGGAPGAPTFASGLPLGVPIAVPPPTGLGLGQRSPLARRSAGSYSHWTERSQSTYVGR